MCSSRIPSLLARPGPLQLFLFPKVKSMLKCKRFTLLEEVKWKTTNVLDNCYVQQKLRCSSAVEAKGEFHWGNRKELKCKTCDYAWIMSLIALLNSILLNPITLYICYVKILMPSVVYRECTIRLYFFAFMVVIN